MHVCRMDRCSHDSQNFSDLQITIFFEPMVFHYMCFVRTRAKKLPLMLVLWRRVKSGVTWGNPLTNRL